MIFSLYVINKAGGLIYQRDFIEGLNRLTSNEYLVLAGTFHGVHAITSKISPTSTSSGIEIFETETFKLQCFQTLTGSKFIVLSEPLHPNLDMVLKRVYRIYADYVMKNPFYNPEMPIRCELFDLHLTKLMKTLG
ncbi:hypothetical protein K7432_003871 [Basidiobolus ranarum]|uniref:Trafficking protein particle complex subunit n=1 Tax=Basidiobolus ranarum TaxID=34480 RepID=A0ABR2W615_9FUNG